MAIAPDSIEKRIVTGVHNVIVFLVYDFKRVKVLRCVGQVARTVRIKKRIRNFGLKT
jgi:hypothetical protein